MKEKSELAAALAKSVAGITAEEEWLDGSDSSTYRGRIARMNYLGQDRSDIQYAVKELSSYMANPTRNGMNKIKRLIRYLKGVPRFVTTFGYQANPNGLTA